MFLHPIAPIYQDSYLLLIVKFIWILFRQTWIFSSTSGNPSSRVYKNNKALIKPYATKKRSGG